MSKLVSSRDLSRNLILLQLPSTLSGTHMKPTFFSSHLSLDLVKADRKPVFTHSDLQRKNILVEEVQVSKGEKEFRVKVVDWESAG